MSVWYSTRSYWIIPSTGLCNLSKYISRFSVRTIPLTCVWNAILMVNIIILRLEKCSAFTVDSPDVAPLRPPVGFVYEPKLAAVSSDKNYLVITLRINIKQSVCTHYWSKHIRTVSWLSWLLIPRYSSDKQVLTGDSYICIHKAWSLPRDLWLTSANFKG